MMKRKNFKIYILFFCLLCNGVSFLHAQADDFRTWTGISAKHKFSKGLSLAGKLELRTKDSMKKMDRFGASLSGSYKLFPFLNADAGYELHYRTVNEGWRFRHRYHLGVVGHLKWQQFKFSLRERFQQTLSEGEAENRLRSRLKVAFEPEKWRVSPYFSVELYQAIGDAAFFDVSRMRYRPGVEIGLSERWSLDVFYCYQYETEHKRHILGVECGFAF